MAAHNELGKVGEEEAIHFLKEKGYQIRHHNWRSGKKELDIVAEYNSELIVIEVKTRRNRNFGEAEDCINEQKLRRIIASTDAYVRKFSIDLPIRFDVIALIGEHPPLKIKHIENAFYPPIW